MKAQRFHQMFTRRGRVLDLINEAVTINLFQEPQNLGAKQGLLRNKLDLDPSNSPSTSMPVQLPSKTHIVAESRSLPPAEEPDDILRMEQPRYVIYPIHPFEPSITD